MLKSLAPSLLITLLLAGCAGSTPSASPSQPGSLVPAPSAAASSAAASSGSAPEPTSTSTAAASPSTVPPAPSLGAVLVAGTLPVHTGDTMVQMAPGPGGGLYVVVSSARVTVGGPGGRSTIALLDATGKPRTGWPIAIVGWTCDTPSPGSLAWQPSVVASDGSVRVVCYADDDLGNPTSHRAFAFDRTGAPMAGWPVDLTGGIYRPSRVVDDRLYVLAGETGQPDSTTGQYPTSSWITTVAADGTLRTGARHEVPDGGSVTFEGLGPDGTAYQVAVVSGSGSSSVAQITAFGLDGVLAGWPVRVDGYPSGLAFGPGGRIYLTAGSNCYRSERCTLAPEVSASRTVVFDANGRSLPSGSDPLPVVAADDSTGAGAQPIPPVVAGDGTAFVIGETGGRAIAYGLDPAGRVMTGWPYRAAVGLERQGRCSGQDTGCGVALSSPAVGPGHILYLLQKATSSSVGGSIVAVGPDGRARAGWPVVLRQPYARYWSVVVGPDGTAYALAVEPATGGTAATILAIAPDGTIRYRTTVATP